MYVIRGRSLFLGLGEHKHLYIFSEFLSSFYYWGDATRPQHVMYKAYGNTHTPVTYAVAVALFSPYHLESHAEALNRIKALE